MSTININTKQSVSGRTLIQRAYELLRQDILLGRFEQGRRLRIDNLKEHYGIGRTPLREALSRLLSDGLVINEEHRGFSIPHASLSDLRDITEQRKLVECTALRKAIENADPEYESRVLAAFHRLTRVDERLDGTSPAMMQEWEVQHREYHRILIEGAHSPWLTRFQKILYDQADRYRRLYIQKTMVPESVRDDHLAIKNAVIAQDADQACALLARHIERVYEIGSQSPYFTRKS